MSHLISIRVDEKTYDFIKSVDGNFSEIWQLGFDQWSHRYPDFLQEKAKEYNKLYIQCIDKMQKCIDNVYTKNKVLDKIYAQYVENGRSINNPTALDKNWVKSRIKKCNGMSVDQFFDYCVHRFNNDKQKVLEV